VKPELIGRRLSQRAVPYQLIEKKNWREYVFFRDETVIEITTKHVIITPPEISHDDLMGAIDISIAFYWPMR